MLLILNINNISSATENKQMGCLVQTFNPDVFKPLISLTSCFLCADGEKWGGTLSSFSPGDPLLVEFITAGKETCVSLYAMVLIG